MRFSGQSSQCRASWMSVHRPANWPACRNDRFWHFSCAAPVIIVASCCFSVGCDLWLGAVPPPSVVQLADSDTCFNDSLFCMRSPWRVDLKKQKKQTHSLLSVCTPGMCIGTQHVESLLNYRTNINRGTIIWNIKFWQVWTLDHHPLDDLTPRQITQPHKL